MSPNLHATRIMLADDHAVVRLGFRLLLEGVGAEVVAEAVKANARTPFRDDVWQQLLEGIRFVSGDLDDDQAFDRLIALIRETAGADRDAVRVRLLELFEIVGPADPAVLKARRDLMSALF